MKFALYIIFMLLIASIAVSQPLNAQAINPNMFQKHLNYLASDIFEGRATGTLGAELAAKYLAAEFNQIGLIPKGNNSTYYQHIPMHSTSAMAESKLTIFQKNTFHELAINEDYLVYKTGEQVFLPKSSELVFAGFGIIAPEYDYNDYQSIDVRGKVVVVLEGEPYSDDTEYFSGQQKTMYSHPESKQILAASRGAIACIIVPHPTESDFNNWERIKSQYMFDDITLAYSYTSNLCIILNPNISHILFSDSELDLTEVWELAEANKIYAFPLKSTFSFNGAYKRKDFVSQNIAGMIRGSSQQMRDSYILISAHYDHLGIGYPIDGDSIYNGLTDNAMGCAALLEIARAISQMPTPPKRSILFLLTTGEEKGLLGSTFYTDVPLVPLYKTVANVNIDGIAFFDRFKSVIPVGAKYSNIGDFLDEALSGRNISISKIPEPFVQAESFNFSDQLAFARAGIPSVLIVDGPYYENLTYQEGIDKLIYFSKNIYHTPQDDLSLVINIDAAMQHTALLLKFIIHLANSEETVEWNSDSPFINARLRSAAEKR